MGLVIGVYCVALAVLALVLGPPVWRVIVAPKLLPVPKPGEVWLFRGTGDGDPWTKDELHQVEVLDSREGWVRYKFVGSTVFQDERMKLDSFRYCYQPTNGA